MGLLIEFTLSIDIDTVDELTQEMKAELFETLSALEEVLGKHGMNLNDSSWEEL